MILLGDPIPARVAPESYGLVNRVVSATEFPKAVEEAAAKLAALPASSVRASKRLLARSFEMSFDDFRALMEEFAGCLASDEHRRAMEALRRARRAS